MAITKILRRKSRADKLIAYALNPEKTENGSLTAHIHCSDGYAAREMQSVREKVLTLPSETKVLSGHGPATSIEYEQANNPYA